MTGNRVLFLIIITMTITASCLAFAENQYADDVAVIEAMASAMGEFADKMEAADSPENVIAATDALSDALDKIGQKMKAVTEKHPDWIDTPPTEVTDVMERYKVAEGRFNSSLNELVRYTNDHADNQPLHDAFMRLNQIIYNMYQ
jgi:flagellar hook-basal body complex protein FliE